MKHPVDGGPNWVVNGVKHQKNVHTREYTKGRKDWWINGQWDRTNGPVVECAVGRQIWHISGNQKTPEEI